MTTPYQPFLVANKRTATDLGITDSWITPEDAFTQLFDGYNYRGVTYKRAGYSWFDSFPSSIGLGAYVNISNVTTTASAEVTTVAPHGLSNGTVVRLTGIVGITGGDSNINGTRWTITVTGADTFTINNASPFTGAYVSGGTVSTFLGNPITMIAVWINPTDNETIIIVCDTKRAAYYDTTIQALTPIGFTDQFTRTGDFKFWYENYFGYLFITNNFDTIFYYNGTQNATGLTAFQPQYGTTGSDLVNTCLMIRGFGNRLVLFNTLENSVRQPTRIRWCEQGVDPTTNNTYPGTWTDGSLQPGLGGHADLSGSQYLISQGQIQDNILLMSQSQGFTVFYVMGLTTDPQAPYQFVRISSSRNVNSTFGTILLDRFITAAGNTGLVTSDGNTVGRYDDRVPDYAMDEIDQENFDNCFGIRYDQAWQTWLLYTQSGQSRNNRALIFNYQDRSWSIFRWDQANANLGFNVLGLFSNPLQDPTWESTPGNWEDQGEDTWASNQQAQTLNLYGGDYAGNIWLMDEGGGDAAHDVVFDEEDDPGLAITMDWTTRQWFPYAKEGYAAQLGFIDLLIQGDAETVVTISFSIDNNAPYQSPSITCVNFGNIQYGPITNITNSNPAVVTSSNASLITGQSIYIFGVQGMTVINDQSYFVTVIDANNFSLDGVDSTSFPAYTFGGIWTNQAVNLSTFWTRVWSGQVGTFHQFRFVNQGLDENFELHAMIFWFKKSGARIYQGGL